MVSCFRAFPYSPPRPSGQFSQNGPVRPKLQKHATTHLFGLLLQVFCLLHRACVFAQGHPKHSQIEENGQIGVIYDSILANACVWCFCKNCRNRSSGATINQLNFQPLAPKSIVIESFRRSRVLMAQTTPRGFEPRVTKIQNQRPRLYP